MIDGRFNTSTNKKKSSRINNVIDSKLENENHYNLENNLEQIMFNITTIGETH